MIDLCVLVLLEKGALFLGHPVLTARDILKNRNAKKTCTWYGNITFIFYSRFYSREKKKKSVKIFSY